MKVIGHDAVVARLAAHQPRVALFLGPKAVGKHTTATWYVEHLGIPWTDVLQVSRLDLDSVNAIDRFSKQRGSTAAGRMVIVTVPSSDDDVRSRLMVTLEQETRTRFVLLATNMPVVSIASRGEVFRFGLLTNEQVAEILVLRGAKPEEAAATATYAAGSMDIFWLAKQVVEVKPAVQQALRAIHARDAEGLDMIAPRWSELATQWLARWCAEAYTGRWRWFNKEFTEIEDPAMALRILLAISRDVRPALIVRTCLMNLIKERRA